MFGYHVANFSPISIGANVNQTPSELTDAANYGHYIFDDDTNEILSTDRVFQLRDIMQGSELDVDLIAAVEDRELSADTGWWTKGTNVSISGGTGNFAAASSPNGLRRNGLLIAGKVVQVEFDILEISGAGSLWANVGTQGWNAQNTVGKYLHDIIVGAGTDFYIRPTGGAVTGKVDNLRARYIKGNHLCEIVNTPVLGADYIQFDGVNDKLRTAVGAASIGTVYIVAQRVGTDDVFDVFNSLTGIGEYANNRLTIGANDALSAFYNIRIKEILVRSVTDDAGTISRINAYLKKKFDIVPMGAASVPVQLNSFVDLYQTPTKDICIVHVGDSISTNMGHTPPRTDASSRPPLMTEYNLPSYIEQKLRFAGQQYRRYDYAGIFTETGTAETKSSDAAWNWQGTAATRNMLYPLTRLLTGVNASVAYSFPANMVRCDFIYHTDSLWTTNAIVTIAQGNGVAECWNGSAWVEANGFTFSAKESATPITVTEGNILRSQYQKRLKMRTSTATAKGVTIALDGNGRLGYWGIQYSPNTYFFDYILASIGGHNITLLDYFRDWMVDDFNPDLIIQQCCIINEKAQTGIKSGYPCEISPPDFADRFADYYDSLTADYTVIPYALFVGMQSGIVDETTGALGVGTLDGYGNVTIQMYIDALEAMYEAKSAPFVNVYNHLFAIAEDLASETGNIYTSAIASSGWYGGTLTFDSVHANNKQTDIVFQYLFPYLNFQGA